MGRFKSPPDPLDVRSIRRTKRRERVRDLVDIFDEQMEPSSGVLDPAWDELDDEERRELEWLTKLG